MKRQLTIASLLAMALAMFVYSCAPDETVSGPTPPIPDSPPTDNREVSFTIELPPGCGNGSCSSPAVVENGDTLTMAIVQQSSYTDPDGTVFTCEPKATIRLSAKMDTVYAKDIENLTKVKEGSEIRTHKTGTSPVCYQTLQTFNVGGQDIVFDLAHEVYTYVNSAREEIEMPYVKPSHAQLGGHSITEEAGSRTRSAVIMTGVTVRPLAMSRATTITDSTMYEVNVRFSLDIESKNSKEEAKETLEFSVNYVGVVETVTVLKDPIGEVSYVWDIKSGTESKTSPFVKTKGNPLEVWIAQTCSYTDEYGNQATGEPKAKIKLSVERDTVWAKTLDELKAFADKTEGTPSGQVASQQFGSDLQNVDIEWSYEVGEAVLAEKTIPMPFYSLTPVTLKDVSVTELSDENIDGKFVSFYEVTATFSQTAVAENVTTETSEIEIEYVVNYVGAMEVSLVKVEYYPSGTWVDPHDNMMLAYYPKVERYRTYSNGKRIGPDEFYDYGQIAELGMGENMAVDKMDFGKDWIVYHPRTRIIDGDSIVRTTRSTQLSQLGEIWHREPNPKYSPVQLGDWDAYTYGFPTPIDEKMSICRDFDNPDYPVDTHPSGWYMEYIVYDHSYFINWRTPNVEIWTLDNLAFAFMFYDQFLVLDGRRIDLSKQRNMKVNYSHDETAFEDDTKKGVIAKLEVNVSYFGKNFYGCSIDTIYVAK